MEIYHNLFESQQKLESIVSKIESLILEVDESFQKAFADAMQKDMKDSGVTMREVWGLLSKNETNKEKVNYVLDKLTRMYKTESNQQTKERIYQTIKNFIENSDKFITSLAQVISRRTMVKDVESIKDVVMDVVANGKIDKGENAGKEVLQNSLDHFNPDQFAFVDFLTSQNSSLYTKAIRAFMNKEKNFISTDSFAGQKIGADDEDGGGETKKSDQSIDIPSGDEEYLNVDSNEFKFLWTKFNNFVSQLIGQSSFANKNPKITHLYNSLVAKNGSVDAIDLVQDFEDVGLLPYLIRPVFDRIADVIKGNLGEEVLIEFIEGMKFSKDAASSKSYVVGIADQKKIDDVVQKMKDANIYDSTIEKMLDFLENPTKYSKTSIRELMGKYSLKGTKNPSNTVKLRITDMIGRTGKNGVLIDNEGKIRYSMEDFVSWMNLPKDKETEIARKMGFKTVEEFENSDIFKKLANKLLNNFRERSVGTKKMMEVEVIEEDSFEDYMEHMIQMHGNF